MSMRDIVLSYAYPGGGSGDLYTPKEESASALPAMDMLEPPKYESMSDTVRRYSELPHTVKPSKDEINYRTAELMKDLLPENPYVRDAAVIAQSIGADAWSAAMRYGSVLVGNGEEGGKVADKWNNYADILEQSSSLKDLEQDKSGLLHRTIRGGGKSLGEVALGGAAGAGTPGIITMFGLLAGNRSLTQAEMAGLKGADKYGLAARAAAIEIGVTALFSKMGWGGLESINAQKEAAKLFAKGVKNGLKEAGKKIGKSNVEELPEEVFVEIFDRINQRISDVDPNAEDPVQVAKAMTDVVAQTIFATTGKGALDIAVEQSKPLKRVEATEPPSPQTEQAALEAIAENPEAIQQEEQPAPIKPLEFPNVVSFLEQKKKEKERSELMKKSAKRGEAIQQSEVGGRKKLQTAQSAILSRVKALQKEDGSLPTKGEVIDAIPEASNREEAAELIRQAFPKEPVMEQAPQTQEPPKKSEVTIEYNEPTGISKDDLESLSVPKRSDVENMSTPQLRKRVKELDPKIKVGGKTHEWLSGKVVDLENKQGAPKPPSKQTQEPQPVQKPVVKQDLTTEQSETKETPEVESAKEEAPIGENTKPGAFIVDNKTGDVWKISEGRGIYLEPDPIEPKESLDIIGYESDYKLRDVYEVEPGGKRDTRWNPNNNAKQIINRSRELSKEEINEYRLSGRISTGKESLQVKEKESIRKIREQSAVDLSKDPKALEKRIREAKRVLTSLQKKDFGKGVFDFNNKRVVSDDGKYELRWSLRDNPNEPESYNNQQSSIGVVSLHKTTPTAPKAPQAPKKEEPTASETAQSAQKKEPWEMTREERVGPIKERVDHYTKEESDISKELNKARKNDSKYILGNKLKHARETLKSWQESLLLAEKDHKESIKRALSEDKPVPPEVLAEYPDLAKPTNPELESKSKEKTSDDSGKKHWEFNAYDVLDKYKERTNPPWNALDKVWLVEDKSIGGYRIWETHPPGDVGISKLMRRIDAIKKMRKPEILKAISEGKPVPQKVLDDYPDLAEKSEKQTDKSKTPSDLVYSSSGRKFKTEAAAKTFARNNNLNAEPVAVDGGYGLKVIELDSDKYEMHGGDKYVKMDVVKEGLAKGKKYHENLAKELGVDVLPLARTLGELELQGVVERLPGNVFKLIGQEETVPVASKKETSKETPAPKPRHVAPDPRIDRFTKMADALQKQIDDKRREMTQNPTPKRMKEYHSRMHDADNLERGQRALRAMVSALRDGTLPKILQPLKKKSDILSLVYKGITGEGGYYDVIPSRDYSQTTPKAKALQDLIENQKTPEQIKADKEKEKQDKIRELEQKVQFANIPGYFPTPKPVIDRMLEEADIQPGDKVLEPSAGKGNIADAILKEHGVHPDVIEINSTLRDILKKKGYKIIDIYGENDFAGPVIGPIEGAYDKIIMNPPFERGQDIDHVERAYDALVPGGRIVAIMSEHPFFGSDNQSVRFRKWLDEVNGTSEKLPEGSFKSSDRPTGVATRLVVIDKPSAEEIKIKEKEEAVKEEQERKRPLIENAKELQPIDTLPKASVLRTWLGNNAKEDSRFIIDGKVIIDVSKIEKPNLKSTINTISKLRKLDKKSRFFPIGGMVESGVEKVWDTENGESTETASVLGWRKSETYKNNVIYLHRGDSIIPLDANYVSLIKQLTNFDEFRVLRENNKTAKPAGHYTRRAVVLYRGGEKVAVLMPLRQIGADNESILDIDPDTASKVASGEIQRTEPKQDASFSQSSTSKKSGLSKDTVKRYVKSLADKFGVPVTVVQSIEDLPAGVKESAQKMVDKNGKVMSGAYLPSLNQVYLIADGVSNRREALNVVLHEVVGHEGLRRVLGKDYDDFLTYIANSKRYGDEVKALKEKLKLDDDISAADEWFAYGVQNNGIDNSLWSKFKAMVQKALRKLGFTIEFNDTDLKQLVRMAAKAVEKQSNQQTLFPVGKLAGEPMFSATEAKKQTDTPAFKKWFGNSKVVDKNGEPLVVYHGTSRPDRVGSVMSRKRATSGPMPFFTDDPEIASGYAEGKSDTSLANEDVWTYEKWFKIKHNGKEIDIVDYWNHLSPKEKVRLRKLIPRIDVHGENEEVLKSARVLPEDKTALAYKGHWDYVIDVESRGNAILGAIDAWLNSGVLFDEEELFINVLNRAGINGAYMDNPNATYPGIFPVYLNISNPLDTSNIPQNVVDSLKVNAPKKSKSQHGADMWNKDSVDPSNWISSLEDDIKSGKTYAWTSVPDFVTRTLKRFGYDGIKDSGGKYSNDEHTVWIPFRETQVKSSIGNKGTFYKTKKDIRFSQRLPEADLPVMESTWRKQNPVAKWFGKAGGVMGNLLTPISTRLENVAPELKFRLREHERRTEMQTKKDIEATIPFFKGKKKFSKQEKAEFELAARNGDTDTINKIVEKHNLQDAYKQFREALDGIHKRATEQGFKVPYLKTYFPRIVKDSEGLLQYLHGTKEWGTISEIIKQKQKEADRQLSIEEKAAIANSVYMMGDHVVQGKPGAFKSRTIKEITPELNQFYYNTDEATVRYIERVNGAIENKAFFGRAKGKDEDSQYDLFDWRMEGPERETILENDIGRYVIGLDLDPTQENEVTTILKAYFQFRHMGRGMGRLRDIGYATSMGSGFLSALTQIGDSAWAVYDGGARAFPEYAKSGINKSDIKMKDVGLERIGEEFRGPGVAARTLQRLFTMTGLTKIDRMGKEALINATIQRWRAQAKRGKLGDQGRNMIKGIFENDAPRVIEELKSGKITDDILTLGYHIVLERQPVAKTEMPIPYLRHPNGRIFYMLKTFTIKSVDTFRRECFQKIFYGKTKAEKIKGMKNLAYLGTLFFMANASADEIKDFILGRETRWSDRVIDNLLRLVGLSKYITDQLSRKEPSEVIWKLAAPPLDVFNLPIKDYQAMKKAYDKGELGEWSINDLQSIKMTPIVGRHWYYYSGKGAEYREKENEKIRKERQGSSRKTMPRKTMPRKRLPRKVMPRKTMPRQTYGVGAM